MKNSYAAWACGVTLLVSSFAFVGLSARDTPTPHLRDPAERQSVQKSLDLLTQSARKWPAGCVSCHHQALHVVTADAARTRGFNVDEAFLRHQQSLIERDLAASQTAMREALDSAAGGRAAQVGPNPEMIFGYSMFALAQAEAPASPVTETTARYLLALQIPQAHWQSRVKQRPPFEASDFAATALVIRSIQEYAPPDLMSQARKVTADATSWLADVTPVDAEDQAFRLLALHWAGAARNMVDAAGKAVVTAQRPDGGWAQTQALTSDAYATGESLLALRASGVVRENSPEFRRGVGYLLATQRADGSWYVKSRAKPIQKYFDSGFPYGTDQFISYAATCLATLAIMADDGTATGALR